MPQEGVAALGAPGEEPCSREEGRRPDGRRWGGLSLGGASLSGTEYTGPGSEGTKRTGPCREAAGGHDSSPSDAQSGSPGTGQLCDSVCPPSHRWSVGKGAAVQTSPPSGPSQIKPTASQWHSRSASTMVRPGDSTAGVLTARSHRSSAPPHTMGSTTKGKKGPSAGTGSAWALCTHGPRSRQGDAGSSCRWTPGGPQSGGKRAEQPDRACGHVSTLSIRDREVV